MTPQYFLYQPVLVFLSSWIFPLAAYERGERLALILIQACICFCFTSHIDYNGVLDRVVAITHINIDRLRIGNTTYADQFRDALNVNGGDVENASTLDYVLHFITVYWKVMFTICFHVNLMDLQQPKFIQRIE